jgi:hypothetical protein
MPAVKLKIISERINSLKFYVNNIQTLADHKLHYMVKQESRSINHESV